MFKNKTNSSEQHQKECTGRLWMQSRRHSNLIRLHGEIKGTIALHTNTLSKWGIQLSTLLSSNGFWNETVLSSAYCFSLRTSLLRHLCNVDDGRARLVPTCYFPEAAAVFRASLQSQHSDRTLDLVQEAALFQVHFQHPSQISLLNPDKKSGDTDSINPICVNFWCLDPAVKSIFGFTNWEELYKFTKLGTKWGSHRSLCQCQGSRASALFPTLGASSPQRRKWVAQGSRPEQSCLPNTDRNQIITEIWFWISSHYCMVTQPPCESRTLNMSLKICKEQRKIFFLACAPTEKASWQTDKMLLAVQTKIMLTRAHYTPHSELLTWKKPHLLTH